MRKKYIADKLEDRLPKVELPSTGNSDFGIFMRLLEEFFEANGAHCCDCEVEFDEKDGDFWINMNRSTWANGLCIEIKNTVKLIVTGDMKELMADVIAINAEMLDMSIALRKQVEATPTLCAKYKAEGKTPGFNALTEPTEAGAILDKICILADKISGKKTD